MQRFYPASVRDLREGLDMAGFFHGRRLFPMADRTVEPETALEQFQFEEDLKQDNIALPGGPSVSRLQLLLTDPNFPALQLAASDAALKAEAQTQQQNTAQNRARPRRTQNTDLTAAEIQDEHAEDETYWQDPTGWALAEEDYIPGTEKTHGGMSTEAEVEEARQLAKSMSDAAKLGR